MDNYGIYIEVGIIFALIMGLLLLGGGLKIKEMGKTISVMLSIACGEALLCIIFFPAWEILFNFAIMITLGSTLFIFFLSLRFWIEQQEKA